MKEPQKEVQPQTDIKGEGVGESTKKMLKELINDLQLPPRASKMAPEAKPTPNSESDDSKAALFVPESGSILDDTFAGPEDEDYEGPGGTTKRKIKDLWENLKTQLMTEEKSPNPSPPTAKIQQSKIQIQFKSTTPPLGKPKIVLSKEEHDKLKALRNMK